MDKGSKERSPPHNLGRNRVNTYAVRITMLIADIEDDIMDPVMQCTTLPSHSGFSQQKLVSFVTEIHTTSIDFLTPIHKLLTRVLRIILVIVPEHPSDTYDTMMMESCLSQHQKALKTFRFELENPVRRLFEIYWIKGINIYTVKWSYGNRRILKVGDGVASFQLESNALPTCSCSTTKTYFKQFKISRIMKAQELKTKTSAQTLIYKIFLQRYQVYQGRLLASFQDDAKYEHVSQDTRSQGGKDDQDRRIKI
ncbi:hypothetical protein Tco_1128013 [Tanacetum coccineum]